MPVLPLVGSTIRVSGVIFPSRSAAAIMAAAMRSLTLPSGLKNSSLAKIRAGRPAAMRFNCTRGVDPIVLPMVA